MFSATKSKLISHPKRIAAKEKRDTGNKKRSTNVSSSSIMATSKYEKEISATINTVVKELKFYSPAPDRVGAVSFIINPNQCRHYDILVCNVPTDKYSELGLAIDDNLFIPTDMYGTTCGFDSSCPTMGGGGGFL